MQLYSGSGREEEETMRQKHMFFDAEEYWRDKPYKCWVVCLYSGKGSIKPSTSGRRKEYRAYYNVQARTAERAIEVARCYCTVLSGRIYGTARLATPGDLGYSMP